jgi:hypothetical protein
MKFKINSIIIGHTADIKSTHNKQKQPTVEIPQLSLINVREKLRKQKRHINPKKKEKKVQAGRHCWKPRPSGRIQSTSWYLKMGGRVLPIAVDGE